MKEYVATITKRGQVTVPAEVQRLLDLHPGDKLRFVVSDHHVQLLPTEFTLESAFGSVKPVEGFDDDLDFDDQIAVAKEDRASRHLDDLG